MTVVDTPEGIEFYRLNAYRHALRLELRTGMRMSRGVNPAALLKQEFGWKGNKEKILSLLEAHINEKYPGILR